MKKRLAALILAAVMAMSMTACGGDAPAPAATQAADGGEETKPEGAAQEVVQVEAGESSKDELIVANTSGEPGNLHPYDILSVGAALVQFMIMEPLVQVDLNGEVYGVLAESWEATNESITFHLRQGVKFSNGADFTAEDVIFSFNEMMQGTAGFAQSFTAIDAEGVTAPDDYTVVFPMKDDNAAQLGYFQVMLIVDSETYTQMGEEKFQFEPVGTAAFIMDNWVVGDMISLKANENYWGGAPKLKTVKVRTIGEVSQALIEVETGGADIMINPDGTDVERVLNGEIQGVKAITSDTLVLRTNPVNFNHSSKYGGDPLVRQAIAYCIDRESWTRIISPGVGVPEYCAFAKGVANWDASFADRYPYKYDPEKAKELMKQAGYESGITMELNTDGRPYHQALAELLQASLSQIGITVNINTMELSKQKELQSTGEGYDMFLLDNLSNQVDPLSGLWSYLPSQTGNTNFLWYGLDKEHGQEIEDLMYAIRACYDETEKQKLVDQLQDIFAAECINIPVNDIQGYVLANEKLQNVNFAKDVLMIGANTFFE